jgi:hypothetical protein
MRNATSILLFGASALGLTLLGACGGGGDGSRDDGSSGSGNNSSAGTLSSAGTSVGTAGTGNGSSGNTATGGTSATGGAAGGGAPACTPTPGSKKGDGTNMVIDEIDDTNTMFAPAGVGMGSWDLSKDASMGTLMPTGTMTLLPVTGGHAGSALHVTGTALTGWGASLAAFLNGAMGAFDASGYDGVAFWIKGTTTVQEGKDMVMIQARMPDVLPGAGSCCNDKVVGSECYSGHRTVISITADWSEVKIPWTAFQGPAWGLGSTIPFNPNRVRDVNFSFNHDTMAKDAGASFDVWVDGIRFMAKGEMGNVGGGMGGSGNTAGASAMGGGGAASAGTGGMAGTGGS